MYIYHHVLIEEFKINMHKTTNKECQIKTSVIEKIDRLDSQ